jgi:hypothetical protein
MLLSMVRCDMQKVLLTALVLLFLILMPATAVVATYQAASVLHFEKFNDVYQQRYGGIGGNHFAGKLVTHIGTFTIDTQGATIQNLALNSTHDDNYYFTGPRTTGPNASFGFFVGSIVQHGNTLWGSSLNQGHKNPIQPTGHPMKGTITVDFYLISWEGAQFFIEDGTYTHTQGQMSNFSIHFSTDGDFWNASFDPMSVNGGTAGQALPYLSGGGSLSDNDIIYGDPPDLVQYSFSINDNLDVINLAHATDSNKTRVATSTITTQAGNTASTYGVTVTFTNSENAPPFRLKHVEQNGNGGNRLSSIDYSLYFNNTLVDPGDSVPWYGLPPSGTRSLDIMVTGVNHQQAHNALSGEYRDIVYVTVTPIDTI